MKQMSKQMSNQYLKRKQEEENILKKYNEIFQKLVKEKHSEIKKRPKIIFDTDIGSDIDDALALLLLLHLPEEDYELLGITTVYGYVGIRSGVVKKIIEAHEKDIKKELKIPVHSGSNLILNEYQNFDVWHSGTEGIGIYKNEEISDMMSKNNCYFNRKDQEKYDCDDAAKFIIEQVNKYPGEVEIVCLGALSNISKALKLEKDLPKLIKRIVFMGGGVVKAETKAPEVYSKDKLYPCHGCHNMRCDQTSASIVFASGIKIFCVGHTVTHDMWFTGDTCNYMRSLSFHKGKDPYSNDNIQESYNGKDLEASHVVGTLLDVWLKHRTIIFRKQVDGTCPHDALTTLECIYPGNYLKYVQGHLYVNDGKDDTCFLYDPIDGKHFVAIGWHSGALNKFNNLLNEGLLKNLSRSDMEKLK